MSSPTSRNGWNGRARTVCAIVGVLLALGAVIERYGAMGQRVTTVEQRIEKLDETPERLARIEAHLETMSQFLGVPKP